MENKEKLINEGNNYIVLENINKIYPNGVQAVYDFSLDIKKHEFIVFVGPSGCGKSTTLRMVAGLEEITSGKLFIDGKYANDLTPKNRDIAMVFQSYALYPQMSVYNNLAFGLKMRKIEEPILDENNNQVKRIDENKIKKIQKEIKIIEKDIHKLDVLIEKNPEEERYVSLKDEVLLNLKSKKESLDYYSNNEVPAYRMRHYTKAEIDVKVKEAAKILQIEQYLYSKPSELSGGQRQRVALGRAIVRNAKVFLMDEPLSNLDAKLRVNMRSEIIELHNKINSTTIYVTHDQTEAMTMADRIVVMKDGYIQQIGTPKEIYNKPSNLFVATFIGSPAMNILKGVIKKNKLILTDDFKIDLSKDQKESIKKFYQNEIVNLTSINESIDQNIKEELEEKKSSLQAKRSKEKVLLLNKTLNDNKEKIERYNAYLKEDEYEIFFGIRPEDILQASKKNETSSKEIKLIVKIPELLGNEYYIHSEFAGQMITSKIQSKDMIYVGDELNIVFDLDRFNIFDRISEKGIL